MFLIPTPIYKDALGHECESPDMAGCEFTVIGNMRTRRDGHPQMYVGGVWVDIPPVPRPGPGLRQVSFGRTKGMLLELG